MIEFGAIKLLRQTSFALSLSGFLLRGTLMLADSRLLQRRWMRTCPHVIDSLLLASGIRMVIKLHVDPFAPWLATRICALLLYIALGFIALRAGVAVTRSPIPLGIVT